MGNNIGLHRLPVRKLAVPQVPRQIVSNIDTIFAQSGMLSNADRLSGAWPSANKPIACPFFLEQQVTVYQLGWANGSVNTDTCDIGVYDSSWNQKVAAGSTARTGTSTFQWVNVADTVLVPGKYYLVMTNSNTTANQALLWQSGNNVLNSAFLGAFDSATNAHPLPNPLTNMVAAATFVRIPVMMMALQAAV